MKISLKNNVKKFQTGGTMAPADPNQGGAPVEQQTPEQDPIMMLADMSAQALQSQNCEMAMQVCQAFLEIVQQMQGGVPEEPQGEPVFRKGGSIVRRIKE